MSVRRCDANYQSHGCIILPSLSAESLLCALCAVFACFAVTLSCSEKHRGSQRSRKERKENQLRIDGIPLCRPLLDPSLLPPAHGAQIDPQLLRFFIQVTALEAKGFCSQTDIVVAALQLPQNDFALERLHTVGERPRCERG